MAYNYWDFAFNHKEFYQLMYGLGMPTCETVRQVSELATFTELILNPIKELIAAGSQPNANPFMKLHTFWSMLHGLISINMMRKEESKEDMNNLVLRDFISGFVAGLKG